MSKGSKQRPTDMDSFSINFDRIFGNPVKKNMDKIHKPKTHEDKRRKEKYSDNLDCEY
jgi:hypothetical protein